MLWLSNEYIDYAPFFTVIKQFCSASRAYTYFLNTMML